MPPVPAPEICVLWSGGKDSFAALVHAARRHDVALGSIGLVTFVPPHGDFACHPLGVIERQARALGTPWRRLVVDPDAWHGSYAAWFAHLAENGVRVIVTGDQLDGPASVQAHWLGRMVRDRGMELEAPLAGRRSAAERVDELAALGITAVVTGVRDPRHRALLGKPLTLDLLRHTGCLDEAGFDACGELGEFHTIVTAYGQTTFVHGLHRHAAVERGGLTVLELPAEWAGRHLSRTAR